MSNGKQAMQTLVEEHSAKLKELDGHRPTAEHVPQCTDPEFRETMRTSMHLLVRSDRLRWRHDIATAQNIGNMGWACLRKGLELAVVIFIAVILARAMPGSTAADAAKKELPRVPAPAAALKP